MVRRTVSKRKNKGRRNRNSGKTILKMNINRTKATRRKRRKYKSKQTVVKQKLNKNRNIIRTKRKVRKKRKTVMKGGVSMRHISNRLRRDKMMNEDIVMPTGVALATGAAGLAGSGGLKIATAAGLAAGAATALTLAAGASAVLLSLGLGNFIKSYRNIKPKQRRFFLYRVLLNRYLNDQFIFGEASANIRPRYDYLVKPLIHEATIKEDKSSITFPLITVQDRETVADIINNDSTKS